MEIINLSLYLLKLQIMILLQNIRYDIQNIAITSKTKLPMFILYFESRKPQNVYRYLLITE